MKPSISDEEWRRIGHSLVDDTDREAAIVEFARFRGERGITVEEVQVLLGNQNYAAFLRAAWDAVLSGEIGVDVEDGDVVFCFNPESWK